MRLYGRRHWRSGGDGRIRTPRPKGSMQRKSRRRKEVETSFSQSKTEQWKSLGENSVWEQTPQPRDCPERGKEQEILQSKSYNFHFLAQHQDESTRDDEEVENELCTITREYICRHLLNPKSNCTCREKNHFLFRWSTSTLPEQDGHHWTYCWRKIEDYWNVDGERELSDACTGSQVSCCWTKDHQTYMCGSWGRYTRKQTTSRQDNVWPKMSKHMFDAAKKKAKQRWANEKPKLDNARQLRGTFFVEPNDEELKFTIKAARRKLEVPMPAAMPCKIPIKSSGENHRNIGKCKTKYACVVDADETKARRSSTQASSGSHYCKSNELCKTLQSCAQIHSDASSIKNSGCKGGSGESMVKTRENPGMAAGESQKQERSDRRSKE